MNEKMLKKIVEENLAVLIRKSKDYGQVNLLLTGQYGITVRLQDKVSRLLNLLGSGQAPKNESIDDSFSDIFNYALLALLLRRGGLSYDTPKLERKAVAPRPKKKVLGKGLGSLLTSAREKKVKLSTTNVPG